MLLVERLRQDGDVADDDAHQRQGRVRLLDRVGLLLGLRGGHDSPLVPGSDFRSLGDFGSLNAGATSRPASGPGPGPAAAWAPAAGRAAWSRPAPPPASMQPLPSG